MTRVLVVRMREIGLDARKKKECNEAVKLLYTYFICIDSLVVAGFKVFCCISFFSKIRAKPHRS